MRTAFLLYLSAAIDENIVEKLTRDSYIVLTSKCIPGELPLSEARIQKNTDGPMMIQ